MLETRGSCQDAFLDGLADYHEMMDRFGAINNVILNLQDRVRKLEQAREGQ